MFNFNFWDARSNSGLSMDDDDDDLDDDDDDEYDDDEYDDDEYDDDEYADDDDDANVASESASGYQQTEVVAMVVIIMALVIACQCVIIYNRKWIRGQIRRCENAYHVYMQEPTDETECLVSESRSDAAVPRSAKDGDEEEGTEMVVGASSRGDELIVKSLEGKVHIQKYLKISKNI